MSSATGPRSRVWAVLFFFLAAVLTLATHPAEATGATVPTVENRVEVPAPVSILAVGVAEHVRAGQHPVRAGPQAGPAQGCCVAAETGAVSSANAARLAGQLTEQEARAVFTSSGVLHPEVIANSTEIINGTQLGNQALVKSLTADGSNLADWGKYTTQTFRSPSGPFQVHFYFNATESRVFYDMDFKSVFVRVPR
jgi:hypothetical protein